MQANVDPAETAKFDAHADRWWDVRGPLHTLHEINPTRLAWIARHVRLEGAQVPDVGCGSGVLTEGLARAGAVVTGVDLAADALATARDHASVGGLAIDYRQLSAEALAANAPAAFD